LEQYCVEVLSAAVQTLELLNVELDEDTASELELGSTEELLCTMLELLCGVSLLLDVMLELLELLFELLFITTPSMHRS
jgi:hypothetical protein